MANSSTGYPSIDKPWLNLFSDKEINKTAPRCTLFNLIYENNKDYPNQICINYYKNKITYGKLFEQIEKVASAFVRMGVKKGDVVTVCSVTTPEIIYCLYALSRLGAICNIVEPRTNPENIVDRINMTSSKVLVVLDVFYSKISKLDHCAAKTIVTSLSLSMPTTTTVAFKLSKGKDIEKPKYSENVLSWKTFISQEQIEFVDAPYEPNTPAAIIYTSGTTGVPKGAILTNDSLNAVADQFTCQYMFIHERGDSFLGIMPPFIAYGLACGIHMPFVLGMQLHIVPIFNPNHFDQYLIDYRPNVFMGVPAHYEYLVKSKKLKGMDLSFVKCAGMGGDALNYELEKEVLAFLKEHNACPIVFKGYGMTEMSSISACIMTRTGDIPTSVGIPLILNTVSVFEPGTDKELQYGEEGEFCFTGPGMMLGYYGNEEETNKVLMKHSDGLMWSHTQDVGYMDENGFIYFKDRIKRIFVRPDGHNVWPSVIESTVIKHYAVKDCAVVGLPNPTGKNGKIPAAFVVLKDGIEIDKAEIEKELREICLKEIPEREVALLYYFIDEIPHTPIGKVDYRALENGDWEIGEYSL